MFKPLEPPCVYFHETRASCTMCIAVHTKFHGNYKNGLFIDTGSQKQGGIDRQAEGRCFHSRSLFFCRKERLQAAYVYGYN